MRTLYLVIVMLLVSIVSTPTLASPYRTTDTVYNELKGLAAKYPSLVSYEVIGKTIKGKDILLFKVGSTTGAGFMFDGRIHGPEDCGTETGLKFIKWALESTSQDAKDVLSKNRLYFIPVINDATTRQNPRRTYSDGTYTPYGVDLNRNFKKGWGTTGSGDPHDNYDYRGAWAASEPETQAVRYAMNKFKPKAYMNVHCGMEKLDGYYSTSTASNYAWVNKAYDRIKTIASNTGAATLSIYSPKKFSGCGPGGYAAADGCNYIAASSYLFEISTWENMPSTLTEYHNKWWKQAYPVYLGIAQSIR